MTLKNLEKTPWPWFGGKSDAAPAIWAALGDVDHYVEPFAGSLAVLLRRPHPCNRTYHSETVNDLDGLLCNAWRSMQMSPREMAEAASWPVCEADLQRPRGSRNVNACGCHLDVSNQMPRWTTVTIHGKLRLEVRRWG